MKAVDVLRNDDDIVAAQGERGDGLVGAALGALSAAARRRASYHSHNKSRVPPESLGCGQVFGAVLAPVPLEGRER